MPEGRGSVDRIALHHYALKCAPTPVELLSGPQSELWRLVQRRGHNVQLTVLSDGLNIVTGLRGFDQSSGSQSRMQGE